MTIASLWNFVARLTSRRRQEPQQSLPTAIVEQQGAETLPAAGATPDDMAPASEPPRAGAIAGDPANALVAVDLAARSETTRATDAADLAVSKPSKNVAAEPDIPASLRAPQAVAQRRHRNTAGEAVAVRELAVAPTPIAQALSLDDEIKLLRGALASKLRLQNAQLKTMLERFER